MHLQPQVYNLVLVVVVVVQTLLKVEFNQVLKGEVMEDLAVVREVVMVITPMSDQVSLEKEMTVGRVMEIMLEEAVEKVLLEFYFMVVMVKHLALQDRLLHMLEEEAVE